MIKPTDLRSLIDDDHLELTYEELVREDRVRDALECERSLYTFLQRAWPAFDPSPFIGGWHLEAICEHLEAVTDGRIRKLLINVRPRSGKTGLVAVAWPTWTWALAKDPRRPLRGAGVRFLCGSYGANKAKEDGVTARRLIGSEWYQARWGERVAIAPDRDNQERYDTLAGGARISTGIPESLGKGGAIRMLDDPHKTDEIESDLVREGVIRGYREIWSTRENDPAIGAEVMIMQRQAHNDLSDYWIERHKDLVHLCIPAWYEPERHCTTYVRGHRFWSDPREMEGESFWPARYPLSHRPIDEDLGPFTFAGQVQQAPSPRGGGILRREWWQVWPPPQEEDTWIRIGEDGQRTLWPEFSYTLMSVDTAYEEKQSSDYSACTVWRIFEYRSRPRVMLVEAWQERSEIHELVARIKDTATRRHADACLVEAKASGLSVIQELRRLTRSEDFSIIRIDPKGDKTARVHAVVPLFIGGIVFAPARKWADAVIDQCAQFPRGRHDDLVDSATQALSYLRRTGMAQLVSEYEAEEYEGLLFRGHRETVAEGYGI